MHDRSNLQPCLPLNEVGDRPCQSVACLKGSLSVEQPIAASRKGLQSGFPPSSRRRYIEVFDDARQRKHEYMTLEHLLLALIDDLNASGVMKVCDVNLAALRKVVTACIDNDLKTLANDDSRKPRPSLASQRW